MMLSDDQKKEIEAVLDYFYEYNKKGEQRLIPLMLYAIAQRERLVLKVSDTGYCSVDEGSVSLASLEIKDGGEDRVRYVSIEAKESDRRFVNLFRQVIMGRFRQGEGPFRQVVSCNQDWHTQYAMYLLADTLTKASEGNGTYINITNLKIFLRRLELQRDRDRMSVARVIGILADCDRDRKNVVYYPYAGMALASLTVGARTGLYADLSRNHDVKLASILIMYAHGISTDNCETRNSDDWHYGIEPNIVISAFREASEDGRTKFNFCLKKALETMSHDGRFVGITTPKHLFADKDGLIRKAMAEHRLESIVILHFNEVAVVVRKTPIDDYCLRICEYDYEDSIASLYDSEMTKTVSQEQLEAADYDLHGFLIKKPMPKRGYDLVELGDLLEVVQKETHVIKTEENRTRVVKCSKEYRSLDPADEDNFNYYDDQKCYLPTCKVDSDVIVVSGRTTLNPRLLTSVKGVETYVCDGVVLKPKKSDCNLARLCKELFDNYVQKQLLPFGEDPLNKNPYINIDDLLKVKVYVQNGDSDDDEYTDAPRTNRKALPVGTMLHNGKEAYEIQEYIGSGSFGITYRCNRYLNGTKDKDTVVVKEFFGSDSSRDGLVVCPSEMDDYYDKNRLHFIREAKIMSRLGSRKDHIMEVKSVFDSDETQTSYYVMADCRKGSLYKMLKEHVGKFDETEIIENVMLPLCRALSKLHKEKILHLDIKPDNILIDDSDKAVLIDFGISKMYDDSGYRKTDGGANGTRSYAAPEQWNSNSSYSYFSPKPDIFSLAATCCDIFVKGRLKLYPIYEYSKDEEFARANLQCSEKMKDAIIAGIHSSPGLRPDSILEFARMLPGCENIDLEAV